MWLECSFWHICTILHLTPLFFKPDLNYLYNNCLVYKSFPLISALFHIFYSGEANLCKTRTSIPIFLCCKDYRLWKTKIRCIVKIIKFLTRYSRMHQALWQSVLGEIELTVSHATFTTWFKDTELIEQNASQAVVSVQNIFAKKQFEVKFDELVKKTLAKNGIQVNNIVYTTNSNHRHTRINRETTLDPATPATLLATSKKCPNQP